MELFSCVLSQFVHYWCIERLLIFVSWFCILLYCWSCLVIQTKNQQRNPRTKWHHKSNMPNWCLQNISSICTQYKFFLATHGTFYKIGHKASLSKYKKIEITPCILSAHSALKLELNNKNNSRKHANNWKLHNTLLNHRA
jgi:hypothetical protein